MAGRIRNLIVALLLVLGIVPVAAAQTGGVLTGVVYDHAGNPVPGAVLTIIDPSQPGTRVAVTDLRGVYFVDRLDYGLEYDVDVSHPRYRKSHLHASANEGDTPVDISLQPQRNRLARFGLFSLRVVSLGFINY
jgi:hypothetical protein